MNFREEFSSCYDEKFLNFMANSHAICVIFTCTQNAFHSCYIFICMKSPHFHCTQKLRKSFRRLNPDLTCVEVWKWNWMKFHRVLWIWVEKSCFPDTAKILSINETLTLQQFIYVIENVLKTSERCDKKIKFEFNLSFR